MRTLERKDMKVKRISVSEKRQITIPKEYFDALNIGSQIECSMSDNCIIIKPVDESGLDEFSEYILEDIIKEGYKNKEILKEFINRRKKLREAAKKFNKDIDNEAKDVKKLATFDDVFKEGDED